MGAILIQSDKTEDLDFLNEMARRMGLTASITACENEIGTVNTMVNSDEELKKMISHHGLSVIGGILEHEPGDIF